MHVSKRRTPELLKGLQTLAGDAAERKRRKTRSRDFSRMNSCLGKKPYTIQEVLEAVNERQQGGGKVDFYWCKKFCVVNANGDLIYHIGGSHRRG